MTNSTISQHPGTCPDCGQAIKPGERVKRFNLFTAWVHVVCPKTAFDVDPADVCGECFTVRATNGACSCL